MDPGAAMHCRTILTAPSTHTFRRPARLALAGLAALLALAAAPTGAFAATTVYLNRCAGNCQFVGGPDSSVLNTSSVLVGTRTITAFAHGDAVFDAVVACTTDLLRPFDIVVTTIDPSPAAHSELVIAGTTANGGFNSGVVAIAPSNCGYVAGAPAFVFANTLGADVNAMCWAAASQLGSMAGLEPLFNCPDVMSYLTGCGPKSFRYESSSCGTFQASPCVCGGSTRNSHAVMRTVFGGADRLFAAGFE